jgi:hypothetical protein
MNDRTFEQWASDSSLAARFEAALPYLTSGLPLYKRVGQAAACLIGLLSRDFPEALASNVDVLFSISEHVKYLGRTGDYADYSEIPRGLQKKWIAAFQRVYAQLIIAKGRYGRDETRSRK